MNSIFRASLSILFCALLTSQLISNTADADDFGPLELPEIEIPNSPAKTKAEACRAMAQHSYDLCIARGENPFLCNEEYRKMTEVTCFCLEASNQAAPLCQGSGAAGCLQELARCQIEEDVRFNKCIDDGNSRQVCANVRNANLSVCNTDYQACLLMIPPLYLAKSINVTSSDPS